MFAKNQYKLELVDDILAREEPLTLYYSGSDETELTNENSLFTDLCRGGHSDAPNKDIQSSSFNLDRIAGAYWKGYEKNTMLTRIYGLAFEDKEALVAYEKRREEARKRDHKKLGRELDLFHIDEEIGKGLPLWLPKGTIVREEVENLLIKLDCYNNLRYLVEMNLGDYFKYYYQKLSGMIVIIKKVLILKRYQRN